MSWREDDAPLLKSMNLLGEAADKLLEASGLLEPAHVRLAGAVASLWLAADNLQGHVLAALPERPISDLFDTEGGDNTQDTSEVVSDDVVEGEVLS